MDSSIGTLAKKSQIPKKKKKSKDGKPNVNRQAIYRVLGQNSKSGWPVPRGGGEDHRAAHSQQRTEPESRESPGAYDGGPTPF
jgi:hypothetical protein